ncbi:3-phosphoglycerate dehydrogenase [Candidatus Roizmanbacteria bacterium CG22_combo_CG10-13_8_21_14_all_35_9]|uniref:3-phosphoglycerate dehydrogenase n=2 Tax=Candidatus Roizmaniibacteriota TaxID=1752723 RepID=A0A2H0BXN8_9BACT|nr:MAG: 3-phosphoglycerate dehydrogenase [Candidatus Roizmanbacteria bacterium CG22_combo_CG10-13_8_21_14_all_35_9]PIY71240.1 MAG: 3-phosphoglycerate dehydrogenase [Candidatus Roizmanbacteria bacterium CG_4_10_14_0_8_um_filter_35_28]
MNRVLIADKIDEKILTSLKQESIFFNYQPEINSKDLLKIISLYQGLIVRSRTKVTEEVIKAGKNLQVIGRVGSGLDNIDVVSAKKHKIKIVNASDSNTNAVAELTIALILSLLRNLSKAHTSMSQGLWLKKELIGLELSGKTVGIIGYGHIGKKVAKLVRSFGAQIYFYSRSKKNTSLKNLFQKSDIISLHLPLTSQTEKLVNKKFLSLMKPTSFLINSGRGEVIDEKDLYDFLVTKKIAGAALDVFWQEPLPPNSPWRKMPNVILTPHIGASTNEALKKGTKTVIDEIIKILSKK